MKAIIIALLVAYITCYTCYAQGDPHLRTFSGRRYDYQGRGDYYLLKSKKLKVVARQRSWGNTAAVITALAIKFRRAKFVIRDALFRKLRVNGRKVRLPAVGKSKKVRGVKLFRVTVSRIRFVTKKFQVDVQGVDAGRNRWPQKRYFNVIIDTPKVGKRWLGECVGPAQVRKAVGFFKKYFFKKHFGKVKRICTRVRLAKAKRHCSRLRFASALHFNNCVFDRCHKLSARKTKRFYKISKVHKKLTKRALKKVLRKQRRANHVRRVKRLIKKIRRHRRHLRRHHRHHRRHLRRFRRHHRRHLRRHHRHHRRHHRHHLRHHRHHRRHHRHHLRHHRHHRRHHRHHKRHHRHSRKFRRCRRYLRRHRRHHRRHHRLVRK